MRLRPAISSGSIWTRTPGAFWQATRFAIVCPITTRVRPFSTSALLPVGGEILTSHVRSIDTLARPLTFAGAAVRGKLAALIGF